MPFAKPPQPFRPQSHATRWRHWVWMLPALVTVVFAFVMAAWATQNNATELAQLASTMDADAASVEAQLQARQSIERGRLSDLAAELPLSPTQPNKALATLITKHDSGSELWNRLVWLDTDLRVIAVADRAPSQAAATTTGLQIRAPGQSEHLAVALLGPGGQPRGQLLARYQIADLLSSTDLIWLNNRYEVSFVTGLGEVIASAAAGQADPLGPVHERHLASSADTTLVLRPYRVPEAWWQNTLTVVLLVGLLMLGLAASWWLRREMRSVTRAVSDAQTEAAWRQAMEDSALVGLRARDREGRILYVNRTLCQMVGYSKDELIGLMPPLPFWPPDGVQDMLARNVHTLAGEAPVNGFETRWVHRDGHSLDVMVFESALLDLDGSHVGWMGSIVDVSDRKQLEESDRRHIEVMAQHARLNDMGLLASELAHELNQPLTAVIAYAAGLSKVFKSDDTPEPTRQAVQEMLRHARKAGDIVNWIRRQTARGQPTRVSLDLNALIRSMLDTRRRVFLREHITMELALTDGLPQIELDSVGIEQVLVNLLRNAADALQGIEGQQSIRLSTQMVANAEGAATGLRVCVADNGPGLRGQSIEVLCASFHSSKAQGMGLGLGICRSIVELHGGTLTASESTMGGALFCFTLPLIDPATQTIKPEELHEDHSAV